MSHEEIPIREGGGQSHKSDGTLGGVAAILLIPTFTMISGAWIVFKFQPGPKLTSGLQHTAAGIVFAALGLEMIPQMVPETHLEFWCQIMGFFTAVGLLFGVGRILQALDATHQEESVKEDIEMTNIKAGDGMSQSGKTDLVTLDNAPKFKGDLLEQAKQQGSLIAWVVDGDEAPVVEFFDQDPQYSLGNKTDVKPRRLSISVSGMAKGHRLVERQINEIEKDMERNNLKEQPWPLGLLLAVLVDGAVDGMLIGVSYMAGTKGGMIAACGLAIEMGLLGASTSIVLQGCNKKAWQILAVCSFLPWMILFFGLIGGGAISSFVGAGYLFVIAFGVGAYLYLITEELMIEAHSDDETDAWFVSVMFFVGFLAIVLFDILL